MTPALWDRWLDASLIGGYTNIAYHLRKRRFAALPEDLSERHIAITGCNSGLGAAAVAMLAERGAHVSMLCRNLTEAREVADSHTARHPATRLEVIACDLADPDSIRRCVDELARGPQIDALINNAGVLQRERVTTATGVEQSFAVNVLGTFALTMQLSPLLALDGRVVTVSSGGMYGARVQLRDPEFQHRPFDGVKAYAEHKRAQVVLNQRWAALWPQRRVNAMHPGWADTPGVAKSLPGFHRLMRPLLRDPVQGIDTAVWLAVGEDVPTSGAFWCDRKIRPTVRLPHTAPRPGDADALWALCLERTGIDAASLAAPTQSR